MSTGKRKIPSGGSCPACYACSGGAQQPAPCTAGTVAPANNSAECTACVAGTYQPATAQLARHARAPGLPGAEMVGAGDANSSAAVVQATRYARHRVQGKHGRYIRYAERAEDIRLDVRSCTHSHSTTAGGGR